MDLFQVASSSADSELTRGLSDSFEKQHGDVYDVDDEQSSSDAKRFGLNIGSNKLNAKLSRNARDSSRDDAKYLYSTFTTKLLPIWRDISKDPVNFPLLNTRHMKIMTRSEKGILTSEGEYSQKNVNVYRYIDEKMNLYIYRVGYGGSGRDSSIKSKGTGASYGVPVESLIPSDVASDYTKILTFSFEDTTEKKNKRIVNAVKFPIDQPPFLLHLIKQNTELGEKMKDLFSKKKKPSGSLDEDGPFIFFSSNTYNLPSLDKPEKNFWAFCFNRTNLLYIMEVSFGTLPESTGSVLSTPPPPSDVPPPPKIERKESSLNAKSGMRFAKIDNTRKSDLLQYTLKRTSGVGTNVDVDQNFLTEFNKGLAGKNTTEKMLKDLIQCHGESLKSVCAKGAISAWIFAPMSDYAKESFYGIKPSLDYKDVQSIRLYNSLGLFESDLIQRIKRESFPVFNSKGYYVSLATKYLHQENLERSPIFSDYKSWLNCFQRVKEQLNVDFGYTSLPERLLPRTVLRRTLPSGDNNAVNVYLDDDMYTAIISMFGVVSSYVTARTLLLILRNIYTIYHNLQSKDLGLPDDSVTWKKKFVEWLNMAYPITSPVTPNFELIPQVITQNKTSPVQTTNYANDKNGAWLKASKAQTENTLLQDKMFYFNSEDGQEALLQLEINRSSIALTRLKEMNDEEDISDVVNEINDASLLSCSILSFIDYFSYVNFQYVIGEHLKDPAIIALLSKKNGTETKTKQKYEEHWSKVTLQLVQDTYPTISVLAESSIQKFVLPDLNSRTDMKNYFTKHVVESYRRYFMSRFSERFEKDDDYENLKKVVADNFETYILHKIMLSSYAAFFRTMLAACLKCTASYYGFAQPDQENTGTEKNIIRLNTILKNLYSRNLAGNSYDKLVSRTTKWIFDNLNV